jgi:methylated-DNA-[protein]-cysteine S-methyltransferase
MEALGYCLFDTALGRCGVAWSDEGIVRLQLPERSERQSLARLRAGLPEDASGAPSACVRDGVQLIQGLLDGRALELDSIAVDLRALPLFQRRVYAAARGIGVGQTLTYGELARRIGAAGAARAVGQALGRNPVAIIVPCHRVLAAGGGIGGFSAQGGVNTKRKLLAIEQAACSPQLQMPLALVVPR